jgi:hypothetical protein
MKFRDLIRILEDHGFELARQRGSHRTHMGPSRWRTSRRCDRLSSRERRHQIRNAVVDDPAVGTAQETVPRMIESRGKRHGELMSLAVTVAVAEQSSYRMQNEFESNGLRRVSVEQRSPLFRTQIGNGLEIERDRVPQGREDLLERPSLDGNVEVEADRLPLAIPAFGVAMERSVRQFHIPVRIVLRGASNVASALASFNFRKRQHIQAA